MSAGILNLVIEQGATFRHVIEVRDSNGVIIDYSTSSLRAMIRQFYSSASPLETFACSLDVDARFPHLARYAWK